MLIRHFAFVIPALILNVCIAADTSQLDADKKALAPVTNLVADWKGSVMPKGGGPVTDGFSETLEWQFDLKGPHAGIFFTSKSGKYYKSGRIDLGEKPGTFKFTATTPEGKKEEYTGGFEGEGKDKELVFNNPNPAEGRAAKIEFSVIAKGNRLLMNLYQKKSNKSFLEFGLTKEGGGFFTKGDAPECIITGGSPKIKVSYKGKDYYVCCGGCKEAFEANPEKEIAAYLKRKEEEKAGKKTN